MSDHINLDRHSMTFAQAEGLEEIPSPLKLKELSLPLRRELWAFLYKSIDASKYYNSYNGKYYVSGDWKRILEDVSTFHFGVPADEFDGSVIFWNTVLKRICLESDYVAVLGVFQHIIRLHSRYSQFNNGIESIIRKHKAAYALVDGKTFIPIASDIESVSIKKALDILSKTEYGGARAHLIKAGDEFNKGDNASSIREAIHAVEAVARSMEPSATTLAPALAKLEKSGKIHPALKSAFSMLYGYTSDEEGVRHALVEKSSPDVGSDEALFMIGACASFVTYLISKGNLKLSPK